MAIPIILHAPILGTTAIILKLDIREGPATEATHGGKLLEYDYTDLLGRGRTRWIRYFAERAGSLGSISVLSGTEGKEEVSAKSRGKKSGGRWCLNGAISQKA